MTKPWTTNQLLREFEKVLGPLPAVVKPKRPASSEKSPAPTLSTERTAR